MDKPPIAAGASDTTFTGAVLAEDRGCVKCSYNLRGLPYSGICPECGTPVQDSLRGILLQYASAEYLAKLHQGLSLVLNGILLLIVLSFVGVGVGIMGGGNSGIPLVVAGLQLIPSIMILLGYWKYTEPDPGFVGAELPVTARKVMRITVVIQVACTALAFVLQFGTGSAAAGGAAGGAAAVLGGMILLVTLASMAAWAVQFFATMKYTGWLATRVPDARVVKRSGTYLWLLPVIFIVGAVVFIGPLIALVLYWNLLDRLRKHVKSIRDTGAPAVLKGALG